ncbi:MAG: hypothetical protein ACOCYW_03535 [Roseicyclus sp.]
MAILRLGDRATGVRAKCGAIVADQRGQIDSAVRAGFRFDAIADRSAPEVALHGMEEIPRRVRHCRLGRGFRSGTALGCRTPPAIAAAPNGTLIGQFAEFRGDGSAARRVEIDGQEREQLLRRAPPRKTLDGPHKQRHSDAKRLLDRLPTTIRESDATPNLPDELSASRRPESLETFFSVHRWKRSRNGPSP